MNNVEYLNTRWWVRPLMIVASAFGAQSSPVVWWFVIRWGVIE